MTMVLVLPTSPVSTTDFSAPTFDIDGMSREDIVAFDAADRLPATTDSGTSGPVPADSPNDRPDRNARIAARAYALYLSRGGENGDAITDWLEAEREIISEASSR